MAGATDELKKRTQRFALGVIRLVDRLPKTRVADVIGRQLARSGTSVGANYRAACRARSAAEFIAKMGIVEEEADETIYWLELLIEAEILQRGEVSELLREADQLLAMTVASIRTARKNSRGTEVSHSALRTPHSALENA
jgi:four helix bundle protein